MLLKQICIPAVVGLLSISALAWGQDDFQKERLEQIQRKNEKFKEPPLVNMPRVPVNTGFPKLNLGYPTRRIIDPKVGEVVRLAQGFGQTPDFTYSFTHPLAAYDNPLVYRGPYGTFGNSPLVPAEEPKEHPARARLAQAEKIGQFVQPPYVAPHDPPAQPPYLPGPALLPPPWKEAAEKADYLPKLGIFAYHHDKQPVKGAYVTGIKIGGVGHQSGLIPGDVITSINNQPLDAPPVYPKAIQSLSDRWSMEVWNAHTNRSSRIEWPAPTTKP